MCHNLVFLNKRICNMFKTFKKKSNNNPPLPCHFRKPIKIEVAGFGPATNEVDLHFPVIDVTQIPGCTFVKNVDERSVAVTCSQNDKLSIYTLLLDGRITSIVY